MIVTFAHTEASLRTLIGLLVGGDQKKVLAIVSPLSFRELLSALSAQVAMATQDPAKIQQTKNLVAKAEEISARRNRFVHDQLVFKIEPGIVQSALYRASTKKRRLKISFEKVSIETIRHLSEEVAELSKDLVALLDAFIVEGVIPKTEANRLMRTAS